ncbi:S8 family serine peptidase, partial [Patescibacteria group bacterium]|nr:S8 family serine peptidase [Patescibacteria group bacterium]
LGTGGSHLPGTCSAESPAFTAAVEMTRAMGITSFAGSGNSGSKTDILYPACMKQVVSVGAVYDADVGSQSWPGCTDPTTAADQVVCFSQSSAFLDLLTPGSRIDSTVPGGGLANHSGTSMATPAAAAAAALLLESEPLLSPADVEARLKETGVPVADAGNGVTTCRVDIYEAVLNDGGSICPSGGPPPPPPSCTVSLTPASATTDIGDSTTVTASVSIISGSVDSVDFSSSVVAVGTVSPASDTISPYNTVASSLSTGSTTITSDVVMGGLIRCSDTASLIVDAPSCLITAHDVSLTGVGDTAVTIPITVDSISPPIYSILEVLFTVNPPLVAEVTSTFPNPDTTAAYQVEMEALSIGSTTYRATATLNDPGATQCFDEANINVSNPVGWWQVKEGDAVTNGSIRSDIPASCVATPSCDAVFINQDVGDFPGIPSCDGFSCSDFGSGTVSTDPPGGWNAEDSKYSSPQIYDYASFEARIPSGVTPTDPGLILNVADVTTGFLGPAGYRWFQTPTATDLLITNPGAASVGSNKVIVFVDGNLTIDGTIPVNDGTGVFVAIVSGNISVDKNVGGGVGPHLEGLYITDGSFNTGSTFAAIPDDIQLHIRGSVAAPQGTVNLQRNLLDNSFTPGEIFEYGADQAIFFHPDLSGVRTIWREVAP